DGPCETRQPAAMHGGKSRSVHALADKATPPNLFTPASSQACIFMKENACKWLSEPKAAFAAQCTVFGTAEEGTKYENRIYKRIRYRRTSR
ncbi:MAG: hypothetical protein RSD76_07905, partial [Clostridia bacterium]